MAIAYLGYKVDSSQVAKAEKRLDQMDDATGRADKGAGGLTSTARRLAVQLGAVAAAATAVRGAFRASQQYQQITNTLRGMGLSSDQAAATLQSVAEVANRTRAPLDATAKLYQRVSIAGKDLGASSSDVLKFTENVGLALASAGVGAGEARGALLQLSQAMAGGVVRAEEFNSILEGAFPVAQAAADGIDAAGGSVGRLRNLVIEGKVSSEEFFNAILSQSENLEEAFANVPATIGQAFSVLGNNLTMAIGQMDAALGVSTAVADGILFLANNTEFLAGTIIAAATALAASYVPAMYAAVTATGAFSTALSVLKKALIATGIGAIVVAAGFLIGKFISLVKATGSLGGAFVAMKDVAMESLGRIPDFLTGISMKMQAATLEMRADFLGAIADMLAELGPFSNAVIRAFVGPYKAVVAAWGALPGAFKRIGALAINGLVKVVSNGITALIAPINSILEAVKLPPIPEPDLSGWKATVPEAQSVGAAISDAISGVAGTDYVGDDGAITERLRGMQSEMQKTADMARDMGGAFMSSAMRPLKSIQRLREEMAKLPGLEDPIPGPETDPTKLPGSAGVKNQADYLAELQKEADLKLRMIGLSEQEQRRLEIINELKEKELPIQEERIQQILRTEEALRNAEEAERQRESLMDTVTNNIENSLMGLIDGAKSVEESFKSMLRNILAEIYKQQVAKPIASGIGDILGGVFGGANANGNAFSAGRVVPFADGGVVSTPVTFPMAGRKIGLMGEAGPEAIMPLSRGPDGKLGVHARGGGGGNVTVQNHFHFTANGDDSVKRIIAQEAPKIANLTQKQILDQRARGGAFKATFG